MTINGPSRGGESAAGGPGEPWPDPPPTLLYGELASWWPLISAPEDYEEEAAVYAALFEQHSPSPPRTLLELGSGGGNTASHLKHRFDAATLVDRAPGMLEVSRALNPECEHVLGDMRSVRLGRSFDCVLLHDAVGYATSLHQLRAALETVHAHCKPGGVALLIPDAIRETFHPGTSHGGHDGPSRGARYLEWAWQGDPTDTTYVVDFAFLLRDGDRVSVHHDRHVEGLFARDEWLGLMRSVGFEAAMATHRFSDMAWDTVIFIAVRPDEND